MLINKGVAVGEVITLKLTSGEELIAKLSEETPQQTAETQNYNRQIRRASWTVDP